MSDPTRRSPAPTRLSQKVRGGGPLRRAKSGAFLTKAKTVAAISQYLKAHPKISALTISLVREKVVIRPGKGNSAVRRKPASASAPAGFFAPFYTAELIREDNLLALQSATFDPADFRE